MKFSVALIARNEEKTLPHLLESLKGVDEIVMVDTGSTDKTIEVAKSFGVIVYEEKFNEIVTREMSEAINKLSRDNSEPDIVSEGDSVFNFAKARNWIAEKAKNDIIFTPDCDEVVECNLGQIEALLDKGMDRLEYEFIFSFDNEGKPLVKFNHSKFYNRKKFEWIRNIHEVLVEKEKTSSVFTDKILLKHYQNESTDRKNYLKGLAIDNYQNEYNDRNCFYYARELMYRGWNRSAIDMFKKHISNPGWETEKGQGYIYMGDCYTNLGEKEKARECYALSLTKDLNRREPWIALADSYYKEKEWKEAEVLYRTALNIPSSSYFYNYQPYYTHYPYGQISVCLYWLGRKEESLDMLKKAIKQDKNNETYKNNLKFY